MPRQPVTSTSIRAIGYAPDQCLLEIEFVAGRVYDYLNVPKGVHDALMAAESKGAHFNRCIRGHYEYVPR